MKKILLAIETATHACSAALIHGDELYCRFQLAPKEHAHLILPMVSSLLEEAGISAAEIQRIAVGRGPGSFTGVRIAMSVAQGLGFGWNVPLFSISTLAALAFQAQEHKIFTKDTLIIPALDARMQEVYMGGYRFDGKLIEAESVGSPAKLNLYQEHNIIAIGSGWDVYHPHHVALISDCHPHAKHVALIALQQWQDGVEGINAMNALPVYLRDQVAVKSKIGA